MHEAHVVEELSSGTGHRSGVCTLAFSQSGKWVDADTWCIERDCCLDDSALPVSLLCLMTKPLFLDGTHA